MIELPQKFRETITAELAASLDTISPTSIRYNPLKKVETTYCEQVPWCHNGYYIAQRPIFTTDPLFHGGAYYVQEASSMFVGWILERLKLSGARILDLCAAPGGKTTQAAAYAEVVVANEVIRSRARILSENVQRWGSGNIAVTCNDPRDFGEQAPSFFDVMIVDTPCSGEGMFRKDPDAREQWTPEAVTVCAARSRRIVGDAWASLRDGGTLIYSTCTFNRAENQENAHWICNSLGGELIDLGELPSAIVSSDAGYNFYPNMVKGEGFYAVAIRKNGEQSRSEYPQRKSVRSLQTISRSEQTEVLKWVNEPLNFAVGGGSLYGFNEPLYNIIEFIRANFNLLYSGVAMGELIRGALKPSHSLATYYDLRYTNRADLPLEAALQYLRRDTPELDYFQVDALSLVTYRHTPIGWLKRIGNRANNQYPQNLRILHY